MCAHFFSAFEPLWCPLHEITPHDGDNSRKALTTKRQNLTVHWMGSESSATNVHAPPPPPSLPISNPSSAPTPLGRARSDLLQPNLEAHVSQKEGEATRGR